MVAYLLLQAKVVPIDPLDSLIIVAVLLFILSTITEKLTDLVRMYTHQFRIIGILFCITFYIQIIHGLIREPLLSGWTVSVLLLSNSLLLTVIIANSRILEKDGAIKHFLVKLFFGVTYRLVF